MSTDSKSSNLTLKERALVHWYENLIKIMTMDWEHWVNEEGAMDREFCMNNPATGYPQIYGAHCPYCQRYSNCSGCPLKAVESDSESCECCDAWYDVLYTLKYPNKDWKVARQNAVTAAENMIEYIKERG